MSINITILGGDPVFNTLTVNDVSNIKKIETGSLICDTLAADTLIVSDLTTIPSNIADTVNPNTNRTNIIPQFGGFIQGWMPLTGSGYKTAFIYINIPAGQTPLAKDYTYTYPTPFVTAPYYNLTNPAGTITVLSSTNTEFSIRLDGGLSTYYAYFIIKGF